MCLNVYFFVRFSVTDVCNYDIKVGHSLQNVLVSYPRLSIQEHLQHYMDKKYLIIPDLNNKTIHVALAKGETSEDIISAYYHAVLLGLTLCVYNGKCPVRD